MVGIKREDVEDTSDVAVWPENWVPFQILSGAVTQWRVGAGGPIGLDYGVVKWLMDLHKVKKKDHLLTLQAIRTMEAVALQLMHKK